MATQTYNANPTLFAPSAQSFRKNNADTLWLKHGDTDSEEDDDESPIDAQEIFDLLRSINDPEHPLTLEELKVISRDQVTVEGNRVNVEFTPTTPACGMANVIVTKQLNDKERVAAAMEVDAIMESINNCLSTAGRRGEK
ncbi:hypothetical protein FRC00_002866 [Tulasnella sp. 408]|nr:hypothetical protein FRC00_002866 [Tulasnella sp. 408]